MVLLKNWYILHCSSVMSNNNGRMLAYVLSIGYVSYLSIICMWSKWQFIYISLSWWIL
jgi:hypothetical protein